MVDFANGDLPALREVLSLPRWPDGATSDERLQLLHEEAALRDRVTKLFYDLDAGDVDAVMDFYANDCILINPRGRYEGHAAIRGNYDGHGRLNPWMRHLCANLTVRFPYRLDEAYLTSYQYVVAIDTDPDDFPIDASQVGAASMLPSDIWRVVKQDTTWKVVERSIHFDSRVSDRLRLPYAADGKAVQRPA